MNAVKQKILPIATNIVMENYEHAFNQGSLPIAYVVDKPTKTTTESFISRDEINKFITYFLERGRYNQAAYMIFALNTGFRASDCVSLRVCDVMGRDSLTLIERKTKASGKTRTVYFNDAVKAVLSYLTRNKRDIDYLFSPDNHARYNLEYGVLQPMRVSSLTHMIQNATKDLSIDMHSGSHTMRKTFTRFMSVANNNNVNLSIAQKALGHSDSKITQKHYLNIPEREYKDRMLNLNLGLEAWKAYVH